MAKKTKKRRLSKTNKPKGKVSTCPILDYSKPIKPSRYEVFCQKYYVGRNGRGSAILAGFPEKSADSKASQLLRNVKVAGRLVYLQTKLSETSGVTALMLMDELKKVGFANIKDYFNFGNKIKNLSEMTKDQTAAVESVQTTKTGGIRITMHPKLKAIVEMAKHIGFYEKDNRQKAENLADFLKEMKDD